MSFFLSADPAPPTEEQVHILALQVLGTDGHPVYYEISHGGLDSLLGNTTSDLALSSLIRKGETEPLHLVVWGHSSKDTANGIWKAMRYVSYDQKPLTHLTLLFIGQTEDAEHFKLPLTFQSFRATFLVGTLPVK